MTKIIIFGTGKTAEKLIKMMKKELVQILAFADNNRNITSFCNYQVIAPDQIGQFEYDYIFIASVYGSEIEKQLLQLGVEIEKIIRMVPDKKGGQAALLDYYYLINNPFKQRLKQFLLEGMDTELLITGISYHNDGINTKYFNRKTYNFAIRGQDIYYDYLVIKHLFQLYPDYVKNVTHVIVGLSYYSFEYDFSKSSSAVEALRYYPEIKDAHNFIDNACIEALQKELTEKLIHYKDAYELLEYTDDHYELTYAEGEKSATTDSNKDFPYTVFENKYHLKEYINFLQDQGIKPIILIMPVTEYYSRYYSAEKINQFYHNLSSIIQDKSIQVLDYFDKFQVPDENWYHINHLNDKGAVLFTKQLEKDLQW